LRIYLVIIAGRLPKNCGKKVCYLLKERRDCRIPAEEAEKFLPFMDLMDEQVVSHPFVAIKNFYRPKEEHKEEIERISREVIEKKNNNRIKWRIAVHFPHLGKKLKLTWR
jgi:hypothetical protein